MKLLFKIFVLVLLGSSFISCSKPQKKFIPTDKSECFRCSGTGEIAKKYLFFTYYSECNVCKGCGFWGIDKVNIYKDTDHNEMSSETSEKQDVTANSERGNSNKEAQENLSSGCENIQVWVNCPICHGTRKCASCNGDGWDISTRSDGSFNAVYKCPVCKGVGSCTYCMGTGGHYETQVVFH